MRSGQQGPAGGDGVRATVGGAEPAGHRQGSREPRGAVVGPGLRSGQALDAVRGQPLSPGRAVRRPAGRGQGAGPSRPAPACQGNHLPDRPDQRPAQRAERAVGALFGHGVRRQGSHRLRSRRRPAGLRRGDAGPRHRPDGRQGDAGRGRRHLRLRPRLLRLRLVGGPARGRLPDRHPDQEQHPRDGGGGAPGAAGVRRGRRHPVRPGRPPARAPAAAATRSRPACARCG